MSIQRQEVSILGGGLTGLLLARMLAQRDFKVSVFERSADPRTSAALEGRSINLALAERGRRALQGAGLLDAVMQATTAMPGRQIHTREGERFFQAYGQTEHEQIYSVARSDLNIALMNACDDIGVNIRFNALCIDIDSEKRLAFFEDTESGDHFSVPMNPLIAADGAGSIVRRQLNDVAGFQSDEQLLDHGYKELCIPPTDYGAYRMTPNALHIWPRGGYMLIALPNPNGDFTATLFLPNKGAESFEQIDTGEKASRFFAEHLKDAADLMPGLVSDYERNPVGIMGTIRCQKWHFGGDALLIGDAAHAIVPFHGQGMNAAFEDCYLFGKLLDGNPDNWEKLFQQFQEAQLENANAIADMALENYVEMRDSIRDPEFHLQKKLAFELESSVGDHFVPRYSMVMFHPEIDYLTAFRRGRIQAELLAEFCRGKTSFTTVDLPAAIRAARERLPRLS